MKKTAALFLCLVCLLSLFACRADLDAGDEGQDILNPYFTGRVIEAYENGCLLEVTDAGNTQLTVGERAHVNTDVLNCPAYGAGDYLTVSFDGVVAESYPLQILNVYIVSKAGDEVVDDAASAKTENENDDIAFTEAENRSIVADDGTEYTFIGFEGRFGCFGKWDFIGHVTGEEKTFVHLTRKIKTGMYSVNGKQDVLVRYFPHNEFPAIYVKSDLLKTEITLEKCIRFEFVWYSRYNSDDASLSRKGITECERFLREIQGGQTAAEAELYESLKQSDGTWKYCYLYGYVCGVIQDDINVVIPMEVYSYDDKAYSIVIADIEYVLPNEWMDKLTRD